MGPIRGLRRGITRHGKIKGNFIWNIEYDEKVNCPYLRELRRCLENFDMRKFDCDDSASNFNFKFSELIEKQWMEDEGFLFFRVEKDCLELWCSRCLGKIYTFLPKRHCDRKLERLDRNGRECFFMELIWRMSIDADDFEFTEIWTWDVFCSQVILAMYTRNQFKILGQLTDDNSVIDLKWIDFGTSRLEDTRLRIQCEKCLQTQDIVDAKSVLSQTWFKINHGKTWQAYTVGYECDRSLD